MAQLVLKLLIEYLQSYSFTLRSAIQKMNELDSSDEI